MTTATTINQNQKLIHKKDRRFGKGVVIALSRRIRKIIDLKDLKVFRVESETTNNKFYSVIFKDEAPSSCNCPDYERHKDDNKCFFVCKHMYALMAALVDNTVIDETDRKEQLTIKKSYEEDDYSF